MLRALHAHTPIVRLLESLPAASPSDELTSGALERAYELASLGCAVLEPLVANLRVDNVVVQEQAAWTLASLCVNEDNKVSVLQMGVLQLLQHLELSSTSGQVQAATHKALDKLGEVLTPTSRRVMGLNVSPGSSCGMLRRGSPLSRSADCIESLAKSAPGGGGGGACGGLGAWSARSASPSSAS